MLLNNRGQLYKWTGTHGFIKFEGRDVFVHRSSYLQGFHPEIGQLVSFDFALAPNPVRPPMAVRVRVVKTACAVQAELDVRRGLEALAKQGGE